MNNNNYIYLDAGTTYSKLIIIGKNEDKLSDYYVKTEKDKHF